ncbi:hypothetical protein V473_13360 [Sphingobium cupriresistens LL01]|uniref:Uncharacterized protein n=1 Tax=Sphingobium cupriresistens LL01 TaxID=1420583 RepID=A0A0J7XXH2_9SPHN|nr:hypothetical protein V473_13360 [Sphingobium cupriresistens LL01]
MRQIVVHAGCGVPAPRRCASETIAAAMSSLLAKMAVGRSGRSSNIAPAASPTLSDVAAEMLMANLAQRLANSADDTGKKEAQMPKVVHPTGFEPMALRLGI